MAGTNVTLACNHDHLLTPDHSFLQCNTSGKWSPTVPICVPGCNTSDLLDHSVNSNKTGFAVENSSVAVQCVNESLLNTTKKDSGEFRCNSLSNWSSEPIACMHACNKTNLFDTSVNSNLSGLVFPGDDILVTCSEHALLNTTKSTHVPVKCLANGIWNSTYMSCKYFCNVTKLNYDTTNTDDSLVLSGTNVTIVCKPGQAVSYATGTFSLNATVTCGPSSKWQHENFTCKEVCPDLLIPNTNIQPRDYVDVSPVDRVNSNITVNVSCNMGYESDSQVGSLLHCNSTGQWNNNNIFPVCHRSGHGMAFLGNFLAVTGIEFHAGHTGPESCFLQCKTEHIGLMSDKCYCKLQFDESTIMINHKIVDCNETGFECGGWTKEGSVLKSVYQIGKCNKSQDNWINVFVNDSAHSNSEMIFGGSSLVLECVNDTVAFLNGSYTISETAFCSIKGEWNVSEFLCQSTCPAIDLSNGTIKPEGAYHFSLKSDYLLNLTGRALIGQSVSLTCDHDHLLVPDRSELLCDTFGQWNDNPPKCKPGCNVSNILDSSVIANESGLVLENRTIIVHCENDTLLNTTKRNASEIKCESLSKWESEAIACVPSCNTDNLMDSSVNANASCLIYPGTTIKVSCAGFEVLNTTKLKDGLIACKNGSWDSLPIACISVCNVTEIQYNTTYTENPLVENGTNVTLQCPSEKALKLTNGSYAANVTATCIDSFKWKLEDFSCEAMCPPIRTQTNWSVDYNGTEYNEHWSVNTNAVISCPGDMFRNPVTRICQNVSGAWSDEFHDKPCPSIPCESIAADKFWVTTYNGSLIRGMLYNHSTEARFECRKMGNVTKSMCDDGNWSVTIEKLSKCLPADCVAENITGYWLTKNKTSLHNGTASFYCTDTKLEKKFDCHNGIWNPNLSTLGHCHSAACLPVKIDDYWLLDYSTTTSAESPYGHGMNVSISCRATNDQFISECLNGNWSVTNESLPTCLPANCVPLVSKEFWKLSYNKNSTENKTYRHETTASYFCLHDQKHITVICENGYWNSSVTEVNECLPAFCQPIKEPKKHWLLNYSSDPSTNKSYQHNTTATISCPSSGETKTSTCTNGLWIPEFDAPVSCPEKTMTHNESCIEEYMQCNKSNHLICHEEKQLCICNHAENYVYNSSSGLCQQPVTVTHHESCDRLRVCNNTKGLFCNDSICLCANNSIYHDINETCALPTAVGNGSACDNKYLLCNHTTGLHCLENICSCSNSSIFYEVDRQCKQPRIVRYRHDCDEIFEICNKTQNLTCRDDMKECGCIDGQRFDWLTTQCVTNTTCPADGVMWPELHSNRGTVYNCTFGYKSRKCSSLAEWESAENHNCLMVVGGVCDDQTECIGNSSCKNESCQCPFGTKAVMSNTLTYEVCMQKYSYNGEPCNNGEICLGNSVCTEAVCRCSDDAVPVVNSTVSKKVCIKDFCEADFEWPRTGAGYKVELSCKGSTMTRKCNDDKTWGPVDAKNCKSNVFESCALGEYCLEGSNCAIDSSETNVCLCSYNMTSVEDVEKKIDQCKAVKSYVNEPCDIGQVCQGNSTCNGTVCICSDDQIAVQHHALKKEVCTPPGECHTDENAYTDRCSFVTDPSEWERSRDICRDKDSKLIFANSNETWSQFQKYRLSLMNKSQSRLENIWIGLWYNKKLSMYQWVDGTKLTMDHWMPYKFRTIIKAKGFPTPEIKSNYCVASRQADNYEWTFQPCDSQKFVGICDATIRFCPADLGWNKSLELTTHTQPCNEGKLKRECNSGGIWGSPIGSECDAYVNESCTFGEQCMGDSRCEADQTANGATCQCKRGMTHVFDENDKLICRPKRVYLGDNCAHGEKCQNGSACSGVYCECPDFTILADGVSKPDGNQTKDTDVSFVGDPCGNRQTCHGGSVCFNDVCACSLGEISAFDECLQRNKCVHKKAAPHESCLHGETCGGNLTCNSSSICECPIDLPVFYESESHDNDHCVWNYSMVTEPCDYLNPCHPITESKCEDGICICGPGRLHDVAFGMCRIDQPVYEHIHNYERGIKKQYLDSCKVNNECDKKKYGLICEENKCVCPEGNKVVEGKCEDYCGELGGKYMNNPDEWVGCKFPGEGQNCTGMCSPSTLSCTDGKCVSPRAGQPCSFECFDSKTMRCISNNKMARDAIRKTIEKYNDAGKKYNPKYLSQVTNTGICECLPGYTFVEENRTCESLPGRPTKRCSAHGGLCIEGSTCNYDKALCECNAGTEPNENEEKLMVCRKIVRKPDEECGNGKLCINGSECNVETNRCECPNGYAITKNKNCSRFVCEKEKEWPETKSLDTSVQDCTSQNQKGQRRRYCSANGIWGDEADTCFPLTLVEFIEYLRGPRFQITKGKAAVCARMLDSYHEFSNEIRDREYGRKLMLAMELMVIDCPAGVILGRPTIEAELADQFHHIMETLLNASNKEIIESDLATAVTLLEQNAIVADALGQRFLEDTMKKYNNNGFLNYDDKERRFNSSEFHVVNLIIRPGQSHDATGEFLNATCSIDSNTLRSPALLSHKDRFGMSCSLINMSVLLNSEQDTQVKLISPFISVTTTLGWNATRDLMIHLKFHIEKALPKEKIQCGWLHKEPNVGPITFHSDGCVVLEIVGNSVLCTCTADTKNYALRVQIDPPGKKRSIHETIIQWLNRVCLSLSIILLTITSLILLYIRKFQTQRIYLMRILCLLSAFTQSVLLAGMHLTEYNSLCQILGVAVHFLSISVLTCQLRFVLSMWQFSNCSPENFIESNPHKFIHLLFAYLLPLGITVTTFIMGNGAYRGENFCWPMDTDAAFLKYLTIAPMALLSAISLVLTFVSLSKRSQLESFYEKANLIAQSIRHATNLSLVISLLLPVIWISGTMMEVLSTNEWLIYLVRYIFSIMNGIYGITLYMMIVHYNMEVKIGILIQDNDVTKLDEILSDGGRPYYHD